MQQSFRPVCDWQPAPVINGYPLSPAPDRRHLNATRVANRLPLNPTFCHGRWLSGRLA